MADDLSEQIRKAIEQNLPEQIGSALKDRLAAVEKLEADLKSEKRLSASRQERIEQLEQKEKTDAQLNEKLAQIEKRESDVHKRETECKVAEIRISAADSAKADIFKLAEIVFRSPRHVRTISESGQEPMRSNQYGTVGTSRNVTETTDVE